MKCETRRLWGTMLNWVLAGAPIVSCDTGGQDAFDDFRPLTNCGSYRETKSLKVFQLDSILIFLATENRQIIDDMNTINLQESEGWRYPKYICEIVDSDSAFRKILPVSTPTEFAAPGFVGNSTAELLIRWLQSPNSRFPSLRVKSDRRAAHQNGSMMNNDDQWIYRFFVVQS